MGQLPSISSEWVDPAGVLWVVTSVSRRDVTLYSESLARVESVPAWDWPRGLVMHPGAQPGTSDATVSAALVGGASGRHLDRLREQAAELGVDVTYHYPSDVTRYPPKLPSDVELLVVLSSHLGHSQYGVMRQLARDAGVPVVHAPSQGFREALRSELQKLGIRTGRFGGVPAPEPTPYYEWSGTSYVLTSPAPAEESALPASAIGALLGAVLGAWFGLPAAIVLGVAGGIAGGAAGSRAEQ